MKNKKYAPLFASLIMAIVMFAGIQIVKINASFPNQTIEDTFKRIHVEDAEYQGMYQWDEDGEGYRHYYSAEEDTDFYFDDSTGRIDTILNGRASAARENEKNNGVDNAIDDAERDKRVLDYVELLFGDYTIGEWRIVKRYDSSIDFTYEIEEYLEDIPTGSNALLVCTSNAEVTMCTLMYGTIFQNTGKGTASYSNRSTRISEEDALSIAEEYIRFAAQEDGNTYVGDLVSCELKANGDLLYYSVELTAMENDYEIIYLVTVDVYTGEIIECARTM